MRIASLCGRVRESERLSFPPMRKPSLSLSAARTTGPARRSITCFSGESTFGCPRLAVVAMKKNCEKQKKYLSFRRLSATYTDSRWHYGLRHRPIAPTAKGKDLAAPGEIRPIHHAIVASAQCLRRPRGIVLCPLRRVACARPSFPHTPLYRPSSAVCRAPWCRIRGHRAMPVSVHACTCRGIHTKGG